MKSRTVATLFVLLVFAVTGFFFFSHKIGENKNSALKRAKVVTPKSNKNVSGESEKTGVSGETENFETMVVLLPSETLINSITLDLNNDTNDDEVVAVRKAGSPYLWLIPAIFNKNTNVYDRLDPISTNFVSARTFFYYAMDVLGNHSKELIYQGTEESGNYVMKILMCVNEDGKEKLVTIGDFSSDGTVFIQQTERTEAYELSIAKAESFSVWVYKSDIPEGTDKKDTALANQIQQEYKWNPSAKKYELTQEIKVTARRLAQNELSRIMDGTVESFADFLSGLWYKTDNSESKIRYLYFDYKNKEIIQLFDDIQEVYEWEDSKIRHNGIYLTTINSDISNIYRRFDIALVNVDEIRITIHDQIYLDIKEKPLWDGNYKKMGVESSFSDSSNSDGLDSMLTEIRKASKWTSQDLNCSINFSDFTYELLRLDTGKTEKGVYSATKIGSDFVFQFRSSDDSPLFIENCSVQFGKKVITETVKRKKVEKVIPDYDVIILTPVSITPTACYAIDGRTFLFVRSEQVN